MSEREKKIVDEHEDKRIVELEQKFYAYINEHIKEIHIRSHNQAKKYEEKIAELEEKLNAYIKQENSEDNEHRQRIEDLENIEKYHLGRLWGTINTNKNQLSELKNHDIFRIWSSIRGGGKTTLDTLIMNAKGIRRLEEVLPEFMGDMKKACEYDWDGKEIKITLKHNIETLLKKLSGEKKSPAEPKYCIHGTQNDVHCLKCIEEPLLKESPAEPLLKEKKMIHITHCPFCDRRVEVECRSFPDDPVEVAKEDLEWLFDKNQAHLYHELYDKYKKLKERYLNE